MNLKIFFTVLFLCFYLNELFTESAIAANPGDVFVDISLQENLGGAVQGYSHQMMADILDNIPESDDYTAIVAVHFDGPFCSKVRTFGHAALIIKEPLSRGGEYLKYHLRNGKLENIEIYDYRIECEQKKLATLTDDKGRKASIDYIDRQRGEKNSFIQRLRNAGKSDKADKAEQEKLRVYKKENANYIELFKSRDSLNLHKQISRFTLSVPEYDLMRTKIDSIKRMLDHDPIVGDSERAPRASSLNCLTFIEYAIPEKYKIISSSKTPGFELKFRAYEADQEHSFLDKTGHCFDKCKDSCVSLFS